MALELALIFDLSQLFVVATTTNNLAAIEPRQLSGYLQWEHSAREHPSLKAEATVSRMHGVADLINRMTVRSIDLHQLKGHRLAVSYGQGSTFIKR